MSRLPNFAVLAVGGVGVAVQVDVVDAALSVFFAWALPVAAGLLLLGWLAREAWDIARDWDWMGPPDIGPMRRRQTAETGEETLR